MCPSISCIINSHKKLAPSTEVKPRAAQLMCVQKELTTIIACTNDIGNLISPVTIFRVKE